MLLSLTPGEFRSHLHMLMQVLGAQHGGQPRAWQDPHALGTLYQLATGAWGAAVSEGRHLDAREILGEFYRVNPREECPGEDALRALTPAQEADMHLWWELHYRGLTPALGMSSPQFIPDRHARAVGPLFLDRLGSDLAGSLTRLRGRFLPARPPRAEVFFSRPPWMAAHTIESLRELLFALRACWSDAHAQDTPAAPALTVSQEVFTQWVRRVRDTPGWEGIRLGYAWKDTHFDVLTTNLYAQAVMLVSVDGTVMRIQVACSLATKVRAGSAAALGRIWDEVFHGELGPAAPAEHTSNGRPHVGLITYSHAAHVVPDGEVRLPERDAAELFVGGRCTHPTPTWRPDPQGTRMLLTCVRCGHTHLASVEAYRHPDRRRALRPDQWQNLKELAQATALLAGAPIPSDEELEGVPLIDPDPTLWLPQVQGALSGDRRDEMFDGDLAHED